MPSLSSPPASIQPLRQRLDGAGASHEALVTEVLARARQPGAAQVFTALYDEPALAAARQADQAQRRGALLHASSPLAGLPVSVKDLFDVAGETTLAGSIVRRGAAPASADAPAVQRLRAAGAAIVGKTNMTEFAFSGVGINPHYGTPRNPAAAGSAGECDGARRVPGGSSSGAAVSVALGLAVAGLGSDTGGSIRIPAALCGLVGFKNTQARTPLAGAFPLAHSLDTVCAMTHSVADCLFVDGVISGAPLTVPRREGVHGLKLALPRTLMLDALEPPVARAFERTLARLAAAGAVVKEIALAELAEIASINAPGGFSPVEAYATHRELFAARRAEYDPRVAARVALGEKVLAADYIVMQRRRADWIQRVRARLAGFDALICPTVPIVAPEIEPLLPPDSNSDSNSEAASDEAFFKANGLLLRNTFAINFLDGCSFSLPCHEPGELPVGLMLSAAGGQDAALAAVALAVERLLGRAP
ncbi:MAG: amidase [Burkholderiales bacterium]|nr:amidase [Burkholderiales bacterium]